ncbi:MAG: 2Fe-2S iron-sulfur cluster-binding protein [Pseudomonadota bacterium]
MTARRLPGRGLIDRSRPLRFRFDGRDFSGYAGDTLASALIAANVRVLGRSFKYHRPRGLWGAWTDDPNAIMNVTLHGAELPNCPAATTYAVNGMKARAVNAWPTAARDVKGVLDWFHRWLGAGFYYKTFMWPDWHLFEPSIRAMAGLGHVSRDVLEHYTADRTHDDCDLLVVGGGAAGLAAARAGAEAGRAVCLVDDQRVCGGGVYQQARIDGATPADWVAAQIDAILAAGGRVLTETTAYGVYDHGLVALVQNRGFGTAPRLIRMRAAQVVLATGALDRPITFAQNDRPGVMSLNAACELLVRYGVLAGQRLALVANHSLAAPARTLLAEAGAEIEIYDPLAGPLSALGGRVTTGLRQNGRDRVFDAVLVSGGQTPLVHLWRHAGGKLDWCETRQAFLPGRAPEGMVAVGAANGTFDLDPAIEAACAAGAGRPVPRPKTHFELHPLAPEPGGRQWIDLQHDVTLSDIALAARENYASVEHLKRYTTLGMASDQGKTSNMGGLAAMAALQGKPIPEIGTTTFRPPFVPVPLELYHGHRRGQLWQPVRRLPLEAEHRTAGAALGEYGGWLRPGWYGAGDAAARIAAEVRAARDGAGLFDASPLGKIEVMGPDAQAFLNFVYYNTMRTLEPGRIRYGFMLTEGGVVYDDGVLARLDAQHFVVSCSSSHVDGVRLHLEAWRQDGNDPDRIFVHDATQHWATITVTGPQARAIVQSLALDLDLAPQAFPHMTLRQTRWAGTDLRIARVSFSGDLSYEISVRASQATALWQALAAAGATPIGLEALSIMRAEKGYIIVGKDTDGETMPQDLGFDAPRRKKTTAFLGDRSLHTETAAMEGRKQLVGLSVARGKPPLAVGAHVLADGGPAARSAGYVTSSYDSPTLGRPVALGLVAEGRSRIGATVRVWHLGGVVDAQICAACVFDPDGGRLHA